MQRYLLNQGIVNPSLFVGIAGFLINIPLNYMLIYTAGLGFIGSPIATSTSRILIPFMLWGYVYYKGLHKKTWFGWSREMFSWQRIKTYLKFGIISGKIFF